MKCLQMLLAKEDIDHSAFIALVIGHVKSSIVNLFSKYEVRVFKIKSEVCILMMAKSIVVFKVIA
jgi:hypothetical protein